MTLDDENEIFSVHEASRCRITTHTTNSGVIGKHRLPMYMHDVCIHDTSRRKEENDGEKLLRSSHVFMASSDKVSQSLVLQAGQARPCWAHLMQS